MSIPLAEVNEVAKADIGEINGITLSSIATINNSYKFNSVYNDTIGEDVAMGESVSNTFTGIEAITDGVTIADSATIPSAGFDTTVYNSAATYDNRCTLIDTTKLFISYDYNKNAKIATISGSTISVASEQTILPSDLYNSNIEKLSSTKVILIGQYAGDTNYSPYAIACSISGNTITGGTPYRLTSSQGYYPSVSRISDDKAIAAYNTSSTDRFFLRILSLSGTTITGGTQYYHNSGYATVNYLNIQVLTSTTAILITKCKACIITFDSTSITSVGTFYDIYRVVSTTTKISDNSNAYEIRKISDTRVLVSFINQDSVRATACVVLDISGTTISQANDMLSLPKNADASGFRKMGLALLSDTKAQIFTRRDSDDKFVKYDITLSGNSTPTLSDTTVLSTGTNNYTAFAGSVDACKYSNTYGAVVYRDGDNSNYGTLQVI